MHAALVSGKYVSPSPLSAQMRLATLVEYAAGEAATNILSAMVDGLKVRGNTSLDLDVMKQTMAQQAAADKEDVTRMTQPLMVLTQIIRNMNGLRASSKGVRGELLQHAVSWGYTSTCIENGQTLDTGPTKHNGTEPNEWTAIKVAVNCQTKNGHKQHIICSGKNNKR